MFRLLFVMVSTVLVGLGTGYFLWGNRAARLTESINTLTLEMDTMRERLKAAAPSAGAGGGGLDGSGGMNPASADQLRVISESVASLREELAAQKEMLANSASGPAPLDPNSAVAELRNVRKELAACVADKQDLEMRQAGRVPPPPAYQPQAFTPPPAAPKAQAPKAPPAAAPSPNPRPDLSPEKVAPPAAESPPVNIDDPRY